MTETENLREKIHDANIAVHKVEVSYYELFHPEVYSKQEQKRITKTLKEADQTIADNRKKALDFGAGTGNLTSKLLAMGYEVTAVDISADMCAALMKKFKTQTDAKKLVVVNSPIEDVDFKDGQFDLVTCYSVLHHLPEYEDALRRLCGFLRKGGVMYLDHEASPYYWKMEPTMLAELVKAVYFHSNPILNSIYFQMVGFTVPTLDYTLSDYWHKKEHSLDHQKIRQIFQKENFESFQRTDYYLKGSWIFNPIFPVYKHVCRPEMSYWIAKK
jgi:ubiquinone/menaquinone biosynthesis C-methylase UbiE